MSAPQLPPGDGREERVVVMVNGARDSQLCGHALRQHGIASSVHSDAQTFSAALAGDTDVIVVAEEVMQGRAGEALRQFLAAQPDWSALPLVLLCRALPPASLDVTKDHNLLGRGRVTLLESPIRITSFVSAVQMSLYERRQQFRIRDLLEERAAQIRQRDQFMAVLGHELRNPLAAIVTCAEVLQMAPADSKHAASCKDIVQEQAANMKRMLDDLLDISRLVQDKLTLRRDSADLGRVLEHSMEQVTAELNSNAQHLQVDLPDQPLPLRGDTTRLQQVFVNLLQNASRYSGEGGTIELSARRTDGLVEVRVRDHGQGMTAETLEHLFQAFYQAESAMRRPGQRGLGLGLHLAARLVSMHGGIIRAHSEGLGRGSEFVVTLPLQAVARQAVKRPERSRPSAFKPARVLMIDDNRALVLGLKVLLEDRGHEVRLAHDGYAGLEAAHEWVPDAVVIDIGLPGIDGYEVARRLRRLPALRDTRLIALTGYGSTTDRRLAAEAGFSWHLIKPADVAELEAAIAEE
ncbi:MAG: hybrid sensor histidine kinase/response regulator [Thiogranum sp.]|nr:hybrid sensor histidine kinase/response regulator [Thiogranum sp.]